MRSYSHFTGAFCGVAVVFGRDTRGIAGKNGSMGGGHVFTVNNTLPCCGDPPRHPLVCARQVTAATLSSWHCAPPPLEAAESAVPHRACIVSSGYTTAPLSANV